MANERESAEPRQEGTRLDENTERPEQFNELSELSLEERMAVADQIGIPVFDVGEAAATGTVSGIDNDREDQKDQQEEERRVRDQDRSV